MRRSLLVLLAVTAVLSSTAASASAQTLDITFHAALTKPHTTCETVFCAPVSVRGYGEGTLTFTDESFELISDSCAEYTATVRIDFVDADIDPLVMAESGVVCFPGNSFNAPGALQSFGNPFRQTGTFVVVDGPAELIGLTGTSEASLAGAGLRGVYTIG